MHDDALELGTARPRVSRQARLTLAMLVLLPTAAILTAMTALLQLMIKSSHPRAAVLVIVVLGMFLLDGAVVLFAVAWWVAHRRRSPVVAADARGVTVRVGRRATFLGWDAFARVGCEDVALVGWLPPDSLPAAHPIVARLPQRNADADGNVGLILGTLDDVSGSVPRLRAWLGRDIDVA